MSHRYDRFDRERRWREGDWNRSEWMDYGRPYTYDPEFNYERDYYSRDYGPRSGWYGRGIGYDDRDFDRGFGSRGYGMSGGGTSGYRYDPERYGYRRGSFRLDRGFGRPGFTRGPSHDRDLDYETEFDTDWYDEVYNEEPYTHRYTEYWKIPGPFTGVGPKGWQRS